jgi:hypothetical protein
VTTSPSFSLYRMVVLPARRAADPHATRTTHSAQQSRPEAPTDSISTLSEALRESERGSKHGCVRYQLHPGQP